LEFFIANQFFQIIIYVPVLIEVEFSGGKLEDF